METNEKNSNTFLWILGGIVLTALGIMYIPLLIQRMGNKFSKWTSKVEDIDFDNLGPELVKKTRTEEINNGH